MKKGESEGVFLRDAFGPHQPSLALISESGVYKLLMRAQPDRNPAVRKFQDWLARDVLPAIRKDGVTTPRNHIHTSLRPTLKSRGLHPIRS
ncbi:BRO-N domain-containing protein [Pararoseomonas indoligenes]|uniref:Bro-N domain-containing protein n=1 Tax=Roseomonas indoligenes TaxID=2820811 RepID=A0A940S769_9PROT|nr:hypothetical protein [Pararoseomonas indoligenes]